jgi:uncharacterized membrane protein
MSYQEKRSIASLLSTVAISALYGLYIAHRYQEVGGSPENLFTFWASAILLFIAVSVVAKIIMMIAFAIVNFIATREEEPPFTDEMDRLIALKSTRNLFSVFMVGFFLAMLALALGQPPSVMFIIFIVFMVLAGVADDASQIYYYRRGIT